MKYIRKFENSQFSEMRIKNFSHAAVDKAAKRRELGIPDDAVLLLSVGELNNNKNHETVIRAIANMDVYYIIAGNGDLREHLEHIIATLGLVDRVKLLGFRSDVKDLYETADIFVFPSFREGLPMALMEAMASGLPCVVSKIRGNIDLIEDGVNGFYCNPFDANSIAEKIHLIQNNKILSEHFSESSKEKIKLFDISNIVQIVQETYQDILFKK